MSAPTPAPGDDRPREGYYPDPSIPGYVRYWNGASWVAGTSRPAPKDGEPLAPPPGARPSVEETGPHFFDEDPVEEPPPAAASQHGSRPESATAWGADRSGASGSADGPDQRVAWPGAARGADPRVPHARQAAPSGEGGAGAQGDAAPAAPATASGAAPSKASASASPSASAPASGSASASGSAAGEAGGEAGNTFVFRRPAVGPQGAPAPGGSPAPGPGQDEGTMTFRAVPPRTGPQPGGAGPVPGSDSGSVSGSGPGFGAGKAAAARAAAAQTPAAQTPAAAPAPAVPHQASQPQPQPQAAPSAPVAAGGPGGGQSSWAQQVHRLAGAGGDEQPVAPWKPPVEDVFQAAARRQAAARPAGLGKRLAARLIDTVVLAGVTAVAAVPLGAKAIDHVNDKIDEAKLSGETVTVWLLDGTTSTYLGIVLAVLLLFGVVYEALPTAKWGRTLGKKLLGLEVRDIEAHEPPSFGAALRRWLVYSVPGLLVVGVVGVVWCLFDRPWHQCWHDKAAGTFVAG
ncbi:RDD family protein [Streptomyces sp. NPDC048187]|uniref:RDD family protein n=1 Tax=Streptomyces sp. NPDC048187 TaxID=3365509 RepID=UPI00371C205D